MHHFFHKLYAILHSYCRELIWEEILEKKIELRSLAPKLRGLVALNGGLILVSLISTLLLYFCGHHFSGLTFQYGELTLSIPSFSLYFSLLCFAAGWSSVLTGISMSNIYAFAIVVFYFFYAVGLFAVGRTKTWLFVLMEILILVLFSNVVRRWKTELVNGKDYGFRIAGFLLALGVAFAFCYMTPLSGPFKLHFQNWHRWIILFFGAIGLY